MAPPPAELVVIQHVEREGPGLLAEAAAARGWPLRLVRAWAGDPLPDPERTDQILVVLGGPMGIADLADPAFPWLAPTVALLRRRLALDLPVLGICLGAQLLAQAGGGTAVPLLVGDPPLPYREVGFGALHFTRSAVEEPVLRGLAPSELVLHWHGDRLQLPAAATLLASTLPCPEQFFRLGTHAYGLQFHVEVTAAALECWITEDAAFVQAALGPDGAARLGADAARWLPAATPVWRRLIDNLLNACSLSNCSLSDCSVPD
jgi:GMP synthase-like glutamine amidotransferase